MTAGRSSDIQRAIDFLSGPQLSGLPQGTLPPRPDYRALARLARNLGHDLSPDTVREAFRLMIRGRLAAASRLGRGSPRTGTGDSPP